MTTAVSEGQVRELRLALMSLGGPPQAQRHHARVGLLQRACQTMEGASTQVRALVEAGLIDARQAEELEALANHLQSVQPGWRERVPALAGDEPGFDFLWSDALEDPAWEALRQRARSTFTTMRAPDNPRVG